MKKIDLIKIAKSKYIDLFPVGIFILIAALEGVGYPIAGVATIIWLFMMALRHMIKE